MLIHDFREVPLLHHTTCEEVLREQEMCAIDRQRAAIDLNHQAYQKTLLSQDSEEEDQ
jgi:hypothetical protein